MAGVQREICLLKNLDSTYKIVHKQKMQFVVSTIESLNNPFAEKNEILLSISSRILASEVIQCDLPPAAYLPALHKGENTVITYIRVIKSKEEKCICSHQAVKVKTFNHLHDQKVHGAKSKVIEKSKSKHDQKLFTRLLIEAQLQKIDL